MLPASPPRTLRVARPPPPASLRLPQVGTAQVRLTLHSLNSDLSTTTSEDIDLWLSIANFFLSPSFLLYIQSPHSLTIYYSSSNHSPCPFTDAVLQSWVPLLSSWQCKKRYGDGYSSHGTLCAGSPPDTRRLHKNNGCQGNWGGGLVCQGDGGRWVLTGIVSGGYGCSDPSTPALYTRVGRFRR